VFGYEGARQQGFKKHFLTDAGGLRPSLLTRQHHPGDFEFSHTGVTTGFESFMALGPDVFLIWNNTAKSMDTISEEPRWLSAQVPFVELSETFRADPLSAPI
jgi:hypothetical protein